MLQTRQLKEQPQLHTPDGAVNHTQLTLLLRSRVTLYYLMGCVLEMCNIKGPSVERKVQINCRGSPTKHPDHTVYTTSCLEYEHLADCVELTSSPFRNAGISSYTVEQT